MILGFVEYEHGEPEPLSLEMLTLGRGLAERLAVPLHAALVGAEGARVEELAPYGVSEAHLLEHEGLGGYAPEAWAESVVQLAAALGAQVVMSAGSDRGNEVMAHVAARSDLPLAANCTELEPGDPFTVTRLRWGGSLLEEAHLEGATKLLTVAPHAVAPEAARAGGEVKVTPFAPELPEREFRVRASTQAQQDTGQVSLQTARVVVGGGRGVGEEGFAALDELAELLGGAVGCSRAVTSLGWRPHSDQIGQTGSRIAPHLYIACGISGAIQHMVGCKGAKRILVINTDAQAPIIARADYAVIGDAGEVVPALNAEIKKARVA
ncbi:MAG: electron transfer flavoprotein subunit alpha/FixB family protein [Gaiellaceae bacterium]